MLGSMSRTAGDALRAAKDRLAARGISGTDAEELVSRLLRVPKNALHLDPARALDDPEERQLEAWIARRLAGEPVQYITGRAAFRQLDLMVDRRVLIPRPETELLVEAVVNALRGEAARWPRPRVLDLGTGSGAIAISLACELPGARVTATDASAGALDVARANAEALGCGARIAFARGDWFDAVATDDRFDAIVSNPPYVATGEWDELPPEVRSFEPHPALFSGSSGLEALREIIDLAPLHLSTGGLLALELSERRAAEVAAWLEGARDWSTVTLREDLSGEPRILLARRERGPAIAPLQWPDE